MVEKLRLIGDVDELIPDEKYESLLSEKTKSLPEKVQATLRISATIFLAMLLWKFMLEYQENVGANTESTVPVAIEPNENVSKELSDWLDWLVKDSQNSDRSANVQK